MRRLKIKDVLFSSKKGDNICVKGWVKTKRCSKNIIFISLNDGSTVNNLQIIIVNSFFLKEIDLSNISTGSSLVINGLLCDSIGTFQNFELKANSIYILGKSDSNEYPLQPKKHSLNFLRDFLHFRFRTNTFGSIFRLRHAVNYSIHSFFYEKGFTFINTPIITSLDTEGAGDSFRVTTLKNNEADFIKDFFGKESNLTVSGQLALESASLGLSEVYTFGPVFRAENSNTTRHLSEFWMLEVEMAFSNLKDVINLSESLIKYIINFVFENCRNDIHFLNKQDFDNKFKFRDSNFNILKMLEEILYSDFEILTYTNAIKILKNSKDNLNNNFNFIIKNWGDEIQSEHEKYLSESYFKKPLAIIDYPKNIKPFYMRENNDSLTVSAVDIIFPGIGEILGGSEREDRLDKLTSFMVDKNINKKDFLWYINTRLFGSAPHSGFGLGFDRLIQFLTGINNIKDVVPFPRTVKNLFC